jgi:hypothetical protein
MINDLLRWLSRPKPRWVQSRLAVNSTINLTSTGKKPILADLYSDPIEVTSLITRYGESL